MIAVRIGCYPILQMICWFMVFFGVFFLAILNMLWWRRNNMIFQGENWTSQEVIDKTSNMA